MESLYVAYRSLGGEKLLGNLEKPPKNPLVYLPPDGGGYMLARKLKEFYESEAYIEKIGLLRKRVTME